MSTICASVHYIVIDFHGCGIIYLFLCDSCSKSLNSKKKKKKISLILISPRWMLRKSCILSKNYGTVGAQEISQQRKRAEKCGDQSTNWCLSGFFFLFFPLLLTLIFVYELICFFNALFMQTSTSLRMNNETFALTNIPGGSSEFGGDVDLADSSSRCIGSCLFALIIHTRAQEP